MQRQPAGRRCPGPATSDASGSKSALPPLPVHRLSTSPGTARAGNRGALAARLLALGGFMAFASVSLYWYSPYVRPYTLSILGFTGSLLAALALSRARSFRQTATRGLAAIDGMSPRAVGGWVAFGTLVPLLLCLFLLDPIPHIPDGWAYLYQARLFSEGRLYAPAPAILEAFPVPWSVVMEGRVFAVFPPGWPLLLAPGVALGVPFLVNPLLGGASLLAIHALIRRLLDRPRANRVLVLCATSPFYLFMSASFMSHNASLLASALFALGFLHVVRGGGAGWGALSAIGIGFQILVRPVSAAFVWFPIVAFHLLFRRSAQTAWAIGYSIAGSIVGTALYGLYNRLLVGEWGVPPLYYLAPENRYGFGADIGIAWASSFSTPGHDLYRALLNLNFNAVVMNNDLFGWPMASLLFVGICLTFGRLASPHRLALGVLAGFVVSYAGYWYNGVAFGARFYYCLLPYLALLTVEGARFARDALEAEFPSMRDGGARAFVVGCIGLFALYAAVIYMPRVALTDPYWNQRKISYELYQELDALVEPGDLVFVETDSEERYSPVGARNASEIAQSEVIHAWDRGEEHNAQVIAQFPGRRVVHWRYPIERLHDEEAIVRLRRAFAGE